MDQIEPKEVSPSLRMPKVESLDDSSDVSANNPEKCETVESVEIERNELGKGSPSLRKLKVED